MDPLSRLLQSKTFCRAKNRPKPFFVNTELATMVEVFNGAVVKKTYNVQNLFVLGP